MEVLFKQFADAVINWWRNDFTRARIKLTGVYVLFAAIILSIFSYLLYGSLIANLTGRIEEEELKNSRKIVFLEKIADSLKVRIVTADGVTLILLIVVGFYVTGRALRPIRNARERERRFIADAAHELRTPLTVMKTELEVALRASQEIPKNIRASLSKNIEEIDSLTDLTNNLLSLARTTSSIPMREEIIELSALTKEAVEKLAQMASQKSITIITKPIPNVLIQGEKAALLRAIYNVLHNAITYTQAGGQIVLSGHATKKIATLTIEDTGVGITKEDLTHIFEPFYQGDKSRTSRQGAGLGLAISSATMRAHKGHIRAESQLGKGTRILIDLPVFRRHEKSLA